MKRTKIRAIFLAFACHILSLWTAGAAPGRETVSFGQSLPPRAAASDAPGAGRECSSAGSPAVSPPAAGQAKEARVSTGAGGAVKEKKGLRGFMPRWKEGDTWTLKVYFRAVRLGKALRASDKGLVEQPLPQYWIYRVSRIRKVKDARLIRVLVKDKDRKRPEVGSLTFAIRKGRLSLLRCRFLRSYRGRPVKDQRLVSLPGQKPLPAFTVDSAIPYDFPVLPFAPAGCARPKDAALETRLLRKVLFEITEKSPGKDGLSFAMDIEQKEYEEPNPDLFCWKGARKILEENGYPLRGLGGILLYRPFDGLVVRQLWHPAVPWPLLTITPWFRSELVYFSGEAALMKKLRN